MLAENKKPSNARAFLASRLVFTAEEFGAALGLERRARDSLLGYYRRRGRILPVRRGLYWAPPAGESAEDCAMDPLLLAGHMADDAVLAYHTALEFHGRAYTHFNEVQYLTAHATRPGAFRAWRFRPVRFPKRLLELDQALFGVASHERAGEPVRVTGLDRTLVDVLDRPDLGGGWEEVWRSLEMVAFFDLDQVVEYVLLLGNATTAGKVGWFLDAHRDSLMVEERHLQPLREARPRRPHYLSRQSDGPSRLIAEWNLVAPEAVVEQRWAEVS